MHPAISYALMTAVGMAVGVMSAGLGIGGGILMVPALVELMSLDPHTAKGTSLLIILPVAALNAWRLSRSAGDVPWRLAGFLGAGALAGGYAGGWMTTLVNGAVVLWLFIGTLALLGLRTFFLQDPHVSADQTRERPGLSVAIGFLSGLVGGATGTGGGIVLVPLALLAGLTTNARVVQLSNMIMAIICASGSVAHLCAERISAMPGTVGQVNLVLVPFVFLGAQISSAWGTRLNTVLTVRRRRTVMGVLLIAIACRLAHRALGTQ